MTQFKGIHHLAMATRDMDRTIRFWRDLLGFKLVVGLGRPGARQYFFEIAPNTYMTFFEWPDVEPVPEKDHGYPARGPFIFDHVSFAVEDEEALWKLKDQLDAIGFWVSEVIDHGFIHSIYSFDPNGIPIEFSYCVTGVDVGQNPQMLDSSPSLVTREGPDPVPGQWPGVTERTLPEDRQIYPGEGQEVVAGKKKNWFSKK